MKIIFNDSVLAMSPNEQSAGEAKYLTSGLIFEKKLVKIASYSTLEELLKAYNKLPTEALRDELYDSADAQKLLKDPANQRKFNKLIFKANSSSAPAQSSGTVAELAQAGIDQAEFVGEPSNAFAPFMEKKDQILSRLRPYMSEKKIGELFNKLENILPYTEVISLLESIIMTAKSNNVEVGKALNFFIDHFSQKQQYAMSKRIVLLACEYQKTNPMIDIFDVLSEAIHGGQPNVNLGYLSNNDESWTVFNDILMLAQSNLPEQSEEVRRKFEESKKRLQSEQQKINMQRALVDMMKTEEMNKQLIEYIKFLGGSFEELMGVPMYRALKDVFYKLKAGKILLNQANSIFLGDRSPETRATTPFQSSVSGDSPFPSIPENRQPFASDKNKFLKLSSPEVSRFVYSQEQPNNFVDQARNFFNQLIEKIRSESENVVKKLKDAKNSFFKEVQDFFSNLANALEQIFLQLRNGKLTPEFITSVFASISKTFVNASNSKNIKIAQRSPQKNTSQIPKNPFELMKKALNTITTMGLTVLLGFGITTTATSAMRSSLAGTGGWSDVLNGIAPTLLILESIIVELLVEWGFIKGKNAPSSNVFFDQNGQLTDQGKQTLVNAREVMTAIGISEQDRIALSRFRVQKEIFMKALGTKESNLKTAESQMVQTGGGQQVSTVGDLPKDFQYKVTEFVAFCTDLENKFIAALNIFKNAILRQKNQIPANMKVQADGLLAEYQKDLITVQAKKAEWSNIEKIAEHLMRKRIIATKISQLQKQLDTLKKLGIPIANAISGPNGILQLSGKMRREEQEALNKLRKEYEELSQLLKNPDVVSPTIKYPTDTGIVKLPESPDQSENISSPFDEETNLQGVKNV